MTDCNNSSSNISGTPIAGTVTQVGSNLTIGPLVQTNHGFTAGNVLLQQVQVCLVMLLKVI